MGSTLASVEESDQGIVSHQSVKRTQREKGVLYHSDSCREEEDDGVVWKRDPVGQRVWWPLLEMYALGNDHQLGRNIGELSDNLLSHRLLKYHHADGLDQHSSDDLGPFSVEEVVIAVGTGDSHKQWGLQALTQS